MSNFEKLLIENKIYSSDKLYNFILGLEKRYNVINSFEHYNSLVNFSQNKDVPVHEWFKYREGFACIREKRNFIGFELDKEYYDKAQLRIQNEITQLTLF